MSDVLATVPLSAIRIFEAAARLKSFTRAAEELGITQAAVSWQVKALERRLDQALFQRLPREVVLTPSGERLARASSEAVNLLRAAISDLTETGEGVLAITTVNSLAAHWLAPRIGAFQVAHPKIAVRLETSNRLVDLAHDSIDIAIRAGHGQWPGLEAHYLFPNIQTPLCTPDMRDRLGLTRPEDLLTAPRIGSEAEWAVWFSEAGVTSVLGPAAPTRLMADTQTLEVASALGGQGVALGSPILFSPEIAAGRLVRPFAPVMPLGHGYWLVYPKDRRRSPKIAAFREWLLVQAAPFAS
ncbi:LysR substrate-binding domain-containing protein [Caulobacter sp. NIBR1757]|uniref:LysR substrate-binding domain-containing protein n=1 Tax=Caulobacter sp. NIBR1757 TaxID=3016000 RepID=UPI0022F023EF|nr:LysR substrate-binding domain-containing protein [Caulobacter sp. NIBR1757]WGM39446.1 Glycine cleavage system transcriptional activator [Caulobacter sp. NIBR1757]